MKKLAILLALGVFALSLSACGETQDIDLTPTPAPEVIVDEPQAETTPTPEPYLFTLDRYALSADAAAYLSDDADYRSLIDAACAGESSVSCTDADAAARAAAVFNESPYAGFVSALTVTDAEIVLTYDSDVDADAATVDAATAGIIESAVPSGANPLETALSLYRAVSTMTYEELENASLYTMLTQQRGSVREFAAALHYLFTEVGIPARLASGTAGGAEHFWVVATLDGVDYHFDPTFENGATAGAGLTYFGMSDEMRAYTGCEAPYIVGTGDYATELTEALTDDRFDKLFPEVTSWQIDTTTHFLSLAYGFADEYLTSVGTETLEAAAG